MIFDDGYEPRPVIFVSLDNDELHKQVGITTETGWCSLGYFISQYSTYPTNAELLEYCKINYPEYFI